jgi:hypothetical protein
LASPVAPERFQMIAGQVQIEKRRGRLQLVELHFRFTLEPGEGLDSVPLGERVRAFVSEANDHHLK